MHFFVFNSYYLLGDSMKMSDLQSKKIISIVNGKSIGNIIDCDINEHGGNVILDDPSFTVVYPYSKAIAQLIVHEVPKMDIKEISYDELKKIPSKRGTGSLGSSGK